MFVIDVQEPVSGDCAGIVPDMLNIGVDEGREILSGSEVIRACIAVL